MIADKVMGKGETPGYTLVPDFVDGFKPVAPAWSKLTQAERDAKAKELLTEAGFGRANRSSSSCSTTPTTTTRKWRLPWPPCGRSWACR